MSFNNIDEVNAEIARLNKIKKEMEDTKKTMQELHPVEQLAIILHDKLCHWNHTDGCGWFYAMKNGVPKFEGEYSQMYYLHKATLLLAAMTPMFPEKNDAELVEICKTIFSIIKN